MVGNVWSCETLSLGIEIVLGSLFVFLFFCLSVGNTWGSLFPFTRLNLEFKILIFVSGLMKRGRLETKKCCIRKLGI